MAVSKYVDYCKANVMPRMSIFFSRITKSTDKHGNFRILTGLVLFGRVVELILRLSLHVYVSFFDDKNDSVYGM